MAKQLDEASKTLAQRLCAYARRGLDDEAIAKALGVSKTVFLRKVHKSEALQKALEQGREMECCLVEEALLQKALEGNTTACVFWLKNRLPNIWREKPQPQEEEPGDEALIQALDNACASIWQKPMGGEGENGQENDGQREEENGDYLV